MRVIIINEFVLKLLINSVYALFGRSQENAHYRIASIL